MVKQRRAELTFFPFGFVLPFTYGLGDQRIKIELDVSHVLLLSVVTTELILASLKPKDIRSEMNEKDVHTATCGVDTKRGLLP